MSPTGSTSSPTAARTHLVRRPQMSLVDALWILTMLGHAGDQAPAEPRTLLPFPGRQWGGSCCSHPT